MMSLLRAGAARAPAAGEPPEPPADFDPLWDYVHLLFGAEQQPDAAAALRDESSYRHTIAFGQADDDASQCEVDDAQAKFGTKSLLFDPDDPGNTTTGDETQLVLVDNWSPQRNLGAKDFTIECFWRPSAIPAVSESMVIAGNYYETSNDRSWIFSYVNTAGTLQLGLTKSSAGTSGTTTSNNFPVTLSVNTWYHIALCRSGNDLRCFVDGVQVGSTVDLTGFTFHPIPAGTGDWLYIGGLASISQTSATVYSGSQSIGGHLDEFRFTLGAARYTANFTPPAEAFPRFGNPEDPLWNSVLLLVDAKNQTRGGVDIDPQFLSVLLLIDGSKQP